MSDHECKYAEQMGVLIKHVDNADAYRISAIGAVVLIMVNIVLTANKYGALAQEVKETKYRVERLENRIQHIEKGLFNERLERRKSR